jgi:hypothetical protein
MFNNVTRAGSERDVIRSILSATGSVDFSYPLNRLAILGRNTAAEPIATSALEMGCRPSTLRRAADERLLRKPRLLPLSR